MKKLKKLVHRRHKRPFGSQSELTTADPVTSLEDAARPSESSPLLSFLDGVQVLHDCTDAEVDICFIHGLTGNRESTWTAHGQSVPWPQTLLPPNLKKARIITYGYDADVMRRTVAGTNRLIDHATNLLNDLTTNRVLCDASARPLIFVVHSLGGLVCKEAILLSRNHPEPHLKGLFDHVKGVIFMGTPHKGSWMSDWARIPASTFGLVPKSNNMSLLTILQTDNQLLESIQLGFLAMVRELRESGRRLEITCFFEELPQHVVGTVVSKDSATFEGYNSISIHANHSNMVKFGSADDNGFKRLLGELQRWASSDEIPRAQPDPPKAASQAARTFRARGVPLDWDAAYLRNFLADQLDSADLEVLSLAREVHGRSSTGTVHFPDRPGTLKFPLPSTTDQPTGREFIVLDDNFYGITTLYAPPPEDHKLDIIGISGLGGHAFGSFKERGGTHMWLRDSLPYDLTGESNGRPVARILVYGYESSVAQSESIQNLEDLANSFRTQVLQVARPPTNRPIIFIAHSLGGLIVKQTLISLPNSKKEDDQHLLRRVYGIVFFGVPHDGMDITSLIPMVGDGPNRFLIESLDSVNSQILTMQQRDFQTALGGEGESEIVCFYEMLKSPTAQKDSNNRWSMSGPKTVLVTKSSATHCRPWEDGPEHICPINRTHSDMVKFEPLDVEYDKAVEVLSGLARRALTARRRNQSLDVKFIVPYNENPDFIGRTGILEQVKQQFGHGQPQTVGSRRSRVSLFGLGGVGKTQIAIAYVYWLRGTQPDVSVFWVHASNAERFHQAYTSIAQEYQIPGFQDSRVNILALVKGWLEKEERGQWLMVIDNADDVQLFSQTTPEGDNTTLGRYIPECRHGSVLITTRNKQAGLGLTKGKPPIEVEKMDRSEANQLLLKMLGDPDATTEDISTLASRLEYLPLALAQAAAFIQANTISAMEYMQLFDDSDQSLVELLSEPFETIGRDSDTPHALTTTWMISFEQVERQDTLASDVLSFISLLDRQAIPKAFVTHYCEHERPEDSTPAQLTKALGTLKAFCFISETKDQSYDLHRLVQLITRKWLTRKNTSRQFAENALKTISFLYPSSSDYKNWEMCRLYLPHAYAVLRSVGNGSRDEDIANAMLQYEIGYYYLEQGRYKEAEELLVRSIDIKKMVLGEEDPDTLASIASLALTYRRQGRLNEAERLYSEVLKTRESVIGKEDTNTLANKTNLASTYFDQGRYKEAEELQSEVVEILQRLSGEEHPETLPSIHTLAVMYSKQGRWKDAEGLHLRVVEARKRLLGEEHPATLVGMGNLAITYSNQGRWKEAEELGLRVLEMMKKVLGEEHPSTLIGMSNLAATYSEQNRWKEAEELELRVSETMKNVLGEEHPDTVISMSCLAYIWQRQGHRQKAIALQQKCYLARNRVLGPDHQDTKSSLATLQEWQKDKNVV